MSHVCHLSRLPPPTTQPGYGRHGESALRGGSETGSSLWPGFKRWTEHPICMEASVRDFDGATYDPLRDGTRLTGQLARVLYHAHGQHWQTLRELSDKAKAPEASVSARLRDLRKPKFGGYKLEAKPDGDCGTWVYRVLDPVPVQGVLAL